MALHSILQVATRMASTPVALGAIKEFDSDVDRITPYLERVALFLTANGVGEDAAVPAFLSIIGGKAYAMLRDLLAPTPPKDKTYNVLEDTLRQHYQPMHSSGNSREISLSPRSRRICSRVPC